jgi:LysR family glycine cleavage system transcriptional activator
MQNLRSRLPPMNSLAVFESVARHLSLTRAGQELFLSREAVSRQIRGLEEHLGVKLLTRLHRAVVLTEAGKKFLPVVRLSLENIASSSEKIQRQNLTRKISVSATIALSSFWLTPRLARFQAEHPTTEISVVVSDSAVDMASNDIDLGIRYGDGHWPGHRAIKLFDIESFPVCSPDYLEQASAILSPGDLPAHKLVNLSGRYHDLENWRWWLAEHGVDTAATRMLSFDSYANVLQFALDGQGIALGFSRLVDKYLRGKKLLRPIPHSLATSHAVYLVIPNAIRPSATVQGFIDWILRECDETIG